MGEKAFRALGFFGLLFVSVGAFLLLNYFSGITGNVVVEEFAGDISSVFGFLLFFAGIAMLMARAHHRAAYGEIALDIYEGLVTRNAYGHKTEPISVVESRIAAHGPFRKKEVHNVLKAEISGGRLSLDKSGTAVSLSVRPDSLKDVEKRYGRRMRKDTVDRLHDLEEGHLPMGVR